MLLEEIGDSPLEDMARPPYYLDLEHPLLIAVSNVEGMGFDRTDSNEEKDGEGGDEEEYGICLLDWGVNGLTLRADDTYPCKRLLGLCR